jgi:hypothetical protein
MQPLCRRILAPALSQINSRNGNGVPCGRLGSRGLAQVSAQNRFVSDVSSANQFRLQKALQMSAGFDLAQDRKLWGALG